MWTAHLKTSLGGFEGVHYAFQPEVTHPYFQGILPCFFRECQQGIETVAQGVSGESQIRQPLTVNLLVTLNGAEPAEHGIY